MLVIQPKPVFYFQFENKEIYPLPFGPTSYDY